MNMGKYYLQLDHARHGRIKAEGGAGRPGKVLDLAQSGLSLYRAPSVCGFSRNAKGKQPFWGFPNNMTPAYGEQIGAADGWSRVIHRSDKDTSFESSLHITSQQTWIRANMYLIATCSQHIERLRKQPIVYC